MSNLAQLGSDIVKLWNHYASVYLTDLAPENRASYNVRKERKKTNKGAERRWQERTSQSNRSLSSCGR